ncbi:hypothetical protein SH1V18_38800 [Vallitalea longa]|uniref:MPN domain-containing protein n=1 Tax=Vallitalea longa TaxID=2936439 RepID=A0A9W5YF72_9FIRM|nr:JAB domain-containing protein [Vallitalea longa]GKX31400.1 hypothetical protein SH1V18_38800 [Vallitalea longa]
MKNNKPYTNKFLKGLKTLTGVSYKKIENYAKNNNPLNILEHPKTVDLSEKQIQKIGLLNEFLASYNLLKNHDHEDKIKFTSPYQVANYFIPLLSGIKDKEKFMVAFLDNGNNIIETQTISEGTVSKAVIFPRELLKKAMNCDCSSMILAHNHPGGSTIPSKEDMTLTQGLVNIFTPLDIRILDHIIVAGTNYTSMEQKGLIPETCNGKASYEPIKVGKNISEENQEGYVQQEVFQEEEWELEI